MTLRDRMRPTAAPRCAAGRRPRWLPVVSRAPGAGCARAPLVAVLRRRRHRRARPAHRAAAALAAAAAAPAALAAYSSWSPSPAPRCTTCCCPAPRHRHRAARAAQAAVGRPRAVRHPGRRRPTPLVLLVVLGVGAVALVVDALAVAASAPRSPGCRCSRCSRCRRRSCPAALGGCPFVSPPPAGSRCCSSRAATGSPAGAPPLRAPRPATRAGLAASAAGSAARPSASPCSSRAAAGPRRPAARRRPGEGGGGRRRLAQRRDLQPDHPPAGELTLPDPVDVLRYTTDDTEPDYLRMTTLGVYDGGGWQQELLRGNLRDNGVERGIPLPVGRRAATPRRRPARITIDVILDAFWLPLPADPRRRSTSTAPGCGTPAARASSRPGPHHRRRAVQRALDPRAARPRAARPRQRRRRRSRSSRTPRRSRRPSAVARRSPTRVDRRADHRLRAGRRAAGLLPRPDEGFDYAEDTGTGGSPDALQAFLEQRRGFCEQYASAMAAMLRLAGVPSRVAVGFTPGARQQDGSSWSPRTRRTPGPRPGSTGAGWVRFEPTPAAAAASARPPYARARAVDPRRAGRSARTSTPGARRPATTRRRDAARAQGPARRRRPERAARHRPSRARRPPARRSAASPSAPVRCCCSRLPALLHLAAAPAALAAPRRRRGLGAAARRRHRRRARLARRRQPRAAAARLAAEQALPRRPPRALGRGSPRRRARPLRPSRRRPARAGSRDVAAGAPALHRGCRRRRLRRAAAAVHAAWASDALGPRRRLLDGLDGARRGPVRRRLRPAPGGVDRSAVPPEAVPARRPIAECL